MRIAIASQNFRTITGHAGMTRRFMVFDAEPGRPPQEVARLDLPKDQSIHEFRGEGAHPLDAVQVVIAGSAGAGFISRMASRGVKAVATSETDPATAVVNYLAGTLAAPAPDDHEGHAHDGNEGHDKDGGCNCNCGSN
ncbi:MULTISPECIES: NifB/NifX family molybdenum-iron cluster-binding protein [Rhodopseudomonas]|uniref:Nitrogen fixation protein n=1 Tax=Rhodopseudomonas palustris TaxID=1076 RepID=A0A0D7EXE9_RHOPL|nr:MULTISPECIES: NifB/NifX family molybdenum-iron cluster-binding protein [Rhodopseudomonas]KIZ45210.1 nitrogen fixation protein [Rhodopseudomonas palustris]MDF3809589.1 NifB/NifX family molybdenum-iron cluster-binding protein [Rhodopseudomonas sp. BAL398]WOK17785.1 NifB/NifX family molybdenum-iron cluster-binding protein [Rhodopseudomonas sp. BAL398]